MLILKAYKFRIYPNRYQQELIAKTMGCSRFVFNHFLNAWNDAYKHSGKGLSYNACSAQLTQLKKELTWLREVDSVALQSSLKNLDDSFKRFFKKQNDVPRFKSKRNKEQSYTTKKTKGNIAIIDSKIKLPKLGLVKFAKSREADGRIISATVRRNPSGKYFVSLLVETDVKELPKTSSSCGMDVTREDFAMLFDGSARWNSKLFSTLEDRLAKEQRVLSRRKEQALKKNKLMCEAKNYQKQIIKVARISERIANIRADYLHKISTEIVKNHEIIGIENLQANNMIKNGSRAKSVYDASWRQFKSMLEYKAKWYGRKVATAAIDFDSSPTGSNCSCKYNEFIINLLGVAVQRVKSSQ
ncbi:putative transposase in snaA-snaB intergenic region (plasmid) [Peptoclostridium acidaminophilum DSM 3953]|uniref:Putative transposase in snaA-snaB intergenic region n=1 Tax=Peptoclostridium acidaminophilum DSM 3953 TaxID=1286171 RepID=W8TJ43_PEPAC|nr:putative transposase in snaA-snaB intergenic region [Peptoclostridium acidaminophilum DSM 3953]